ncbi:MAG TPA: RNA-binding protein [Vicinamibacteria bacterium]|jgi:RNA recognition motif-containing protein
MGQKVFVGNMSFDTTREELQELFAQAGEITEVVVPTDRMSGRPRGFAFVTFASDEAAAAAIQKMDGQLLGGRNLRVNEASAAPQRSFGGGGGGGGFSRPFGGGGGGGGGRPGGPGGGNRPKGSRRNVRARKRSIW